MLEMARNAMFTICLDLRSEKCNLRSNKKLFVTEIDISFLDNIICRSKNSGASNFCQALVQVHTHSQLLKLFPFGYLLSFDVG